MMALVITHNYLIYLIIQTIGTFVYNVVISRIAVRKYPYISNKDIKPLPENERRKLFSDIRDLAIYKISGLLVNSTDNILITFFKGLSITGIASNYTLLVNTLNALLNQVFNGLIASVGNHNAIEEKSKQYEMFSFLNLMNFWIFGWASIGIIFCSTDIVALCFGENYTLPIYIPLVMALNFYTVGLQNAVWTYKQTLGLFRYGRFLQLITAGLNIFFSIVLGDRWGLFGILFATFLARLFTNLWYDPVAVFTHGFNMSPLRYLAKYFNYLIVFAISCAGCYFVLSFIQGTLIFQVLLKVILCSIITNVIFYLSFRNTKEFSKFKVVLKNIWKLVRNKF